MTKFLLIRHGTNDFVGKGLAGRAPGTHLNEEGRRQAALLAEGLAREKIDRIFSSPLERAFETAEYLAKPRGLNIEINDAIQEVDFGDWTRKSLVQLAHTPGWDTWNQFRSRCIVPNGETIIQVQARNVRFILDTAAKFPDSTIAVCGHADPIKTILCFFLGASLDALARLEICPASVSVLEVFGDSVRIESINRAYY